MDLKLKQKITERWNVITDHQTLNPMQTNTKSSAFAQLEYILIEAGLLAQRRERRSERAMRRTEEKYPHLPNLKDIQIP